MTGKRRAGRSSSRPEPPPGGIGGSGAPGAGGGSGLPGAGGGSGLPGAAGAPVVVPRPSRREMRAQRRRQQRRWISAAGVAAVVVVALVAAALITFGVRKATSHGHTAPLGQTTLLLSIRAADGSAAETALLAHDSRTHQGVELLIPARLITEVCGFGNQQLGQILALPGGAQLSRAAVGDLLGGVSVKSSWVVTKSQLARLVDEVGGITVDVDVNVVEKKPNGSRVLLVPRGPGQHLTGSGAAAFATYVAGNADASANLVRLQEVVDGLLAKLPHDSAAVRRLVASLGPGAGSTLGPARLADVLTGLAADERVNNVLPTDLPVVKIDAGGAPAYRPDDAQVQSFVDANLKASLPAGAHRTRTRVFVQNGVGTPGLVETACSRLVKGGYVFAGSGNAAHFGFATSKVLVFDTSVASAEVGDAVARALKLPTGDVAVSAQGQNVADVVVILGKDYKP